MKKTFYEKKGRRYFPVAEYDDEFLSTFPSGSHLIVCRPGSMIRRYNIDPEFVPLAAAGIFAEEALVQALVQASEMRPVRVPLTERQQKAWRELADSFGDELATLHGPSATSIAQAGVKAMQDEAKKLLTNPAIKKAYEDFQFLCNLSGKQNDLS